jgi:hypothetical protein
MSNHQGSYQNNELLHVMLKAGVFDTLSRPQSKAILNTLACVEDGNSGEIFEDIPESLKYCVYCEDFRDEVKYVNSYGLTLCSQCCAEDGIDWENPNPSDK